MSFPRDAYPYTNFHELNLGYFITHFREIFSQWADLYDQMTDWKDATDEELTTWKAGVETDLDQREAALRAELETWKAQTGQDIAGWEDATLAALTAWQTATQAVFEAIRVEAAGSASAAAASAGDAATAKTAAETAQAAAEAAAASVQASAAQITTNTEDIADLKTQITNITGNETINFTEGFYIPTATPIDVTSPVENIGFRYAVVDCAPGDAFTITAKGTSAAHAFAFIDNAGNVLLDDLYSGVNAAKNIVIVAPANSSKLVLNSTAEYDSFACKGISVKLTDDDITNLTGCKRVEENGFVNNKFLNGSGEVGSNSNFAYTKPVYIPANTHITLIATGGPSAAAIAFTDNISGTTFTVCKMFTLNGAEEKVEFLTDTAGYYSFSYLKANRHLAYTYTINLNKIINTANKNVKMISGILRNSGNGWEFIINDGHEVMNLQSVELNESGRIVVNYGFTAKKVLTMVAAPDETFASTYRIGGSVGLDKTTFTVWKLTQTIGGMIRYRSDEWSLAYTGFTNSAWDSTTGELKLYHDDISDYNAKQRYIASVSKMSGKYDVEIVSFGTDYISIHFLDSGNVVLTPNANCDCIITRTLPETPVDANDIISTNGNFWIIGMMEI